MSNSFEPNPAAVAHFRRRMRLWGHDNFRSFPWRDAQDPFAILIAEMMLRRTRATQVAPVFVRFMKTMGTPSALAAADRATVAGILEPLGLRWRVPAFQNVAVQLLQKHGGKVPDDRATLLSLPGVGPYVADAVLCFGFGRPVSIVDANTVRLAGRYFGLATNAESRRTARIQHLVEKLLDVRDARSANFAMLDLASMVCQPRRPVCGSCPVRRYCATGSKCKRQREP